MIAIFEVSLISISDHYKISNVNRFIMSHPNISELGFLQ